MCYKCPACLKQRALEQSLRLTHQLNTYGGRAISVTFTYNDQHYPADHSLSKSEAKNLSDRLVYQYKKRKRKIHWYIAGEYGSEQHTERAHYHAIIFGGHVSDRPILAQCWDKGFIKLKPAFIETMEYVSKYIQKQTHGELAYKIYGDRQPPFRKCSRGLGLQWARENREQLIQDECIRHNGKEVTIPSAYLKALGLEVSPERKAKLALEKEQRMQEYMRKHDLKDEDMNDVIIKSNAQKQLNQIAKASLKDPIYRDKIQQRFKNRTANGVTEADRIEDARHLKGAGIVFEPKAIKPASLLAASESLPHPPGAVPDPRT